MTTGGTGGSTGAGERLEPACPRTTTHSNTIEPSLIYQRPMEVGWRRAPGPTHGGEVALMCRTAADLRQGHHRRVRDAQTLPWEGTTRVNFSKNRPLMVHQCCCVFDMGTRSSTIELTTRSNTSCGEMVRMKCGWCKKTHKNT
jgi:hypothetical protein